MPDIDRDQLLFSARDFTKRALDAYIANDSRVVLMFSAISLEHLCKAYLYQMDPAFLVDPNSRGKEHTDTLIYFTGHGRPGDDYKVRTIGARDAIHTVRRLNNQISMPSDLIEQLFHARDSVVHAGYSEPTLNISVFSAYLHTCNNLYPLVGVDPNNIWGRHADLVNALVRTSLEAIRKSVERKIAIAQSRHVSETFLSLEEKVSILQAITKVRNLYGGFGAITTTCPACGRKAATYIGNVEAALDPSRTHTISYTLHGHTLICRSCQLTLQGSLEIEHAGIAKKVPYAEAQVSDLESNDYVDRRDFIPYFDDPNFEYERQFDPQDPHHPEDDYIEMISQQDEDEDRW
ncbi:hypothetical protein [Nonomuraea sp. NPDC049695]|uniref:hypothetical protein n=1 Tax=Nonomuraea sp. NPDC049695 TaxID=3154734 RepID=UPI0034445358